MGVCRRRAGRTREHSRERARAVGCLLGAQGRVRVLQRPCERVVRRETWVVEEGNNKNELPTSLWQMQSVSARCQGLIASLIISSQHRVGRSFVSGSSRPDTHPQAPKRRAWEALTRNTESVGRRYLFCPITVSRSRPALLGTSPDPKGRAPVPQSVSDVPTHAYSTPNPINPRFPLSRHDNTIAAHHIAG